MENDSNISQINNLTFNNSANIGNGVRKWEIFILWNNCFDFYSTTSIYTSSLRLIFLKTLP